jgi:hypothetical protein
MRRIAIYLMDRFASPHACENSAEKPEKIADRSESVRYRRNPTANGNARSVASGRNGELRQFAGDVDRLLVTADVPRDVCTFHDEA